MRGPCVYIVSNRTHRLYVGSTIDIRKRIREHRDRTYASGFTARYTYDRLVYWEGAATFRDALKREMQIKGWTRKKKIALIESVNPWWHDLSLDWGTLLKLR